MSIKNKTKKTLVADEVIEAKDLLKKTFGLVLYKTARPMLFQTRFGIHTFFMRYSIDVVVLDNNHIVRALKRRLQPWRVFVWNPKYDLVLELPEGIIDQTKTKLGDICVII